MNQQTYIKKTAKRLCCSRNKRNDFTRQLASDIESALESGENWEAIQKRLGTPAEIAKEINESLGETAIVRHRKKVRIFGLLISAAVIALVSILLVFTTRSQKEKENPVQSQSTVSPDVTPTNEPLSSNDALSLSIETIEQFSAGDYKAVLDQCDDKMRSSLSIETLQQVKEQVMPDPGAFKSIGENSTIRISEETLSYVTVQTQVHFTKQTVTFTLSWNDQKELCGFYLK